MTLNVTDKFNTRIKFPYIDKTEKITSPLHWL